jgi:hypothetical protein
MQKSAKWVSTTRSENVVVGEIGVIQTQESAGTHFIAPIF